MSKLAVVTPAIEAGASPTRVMHFEDGSFLLLDADASDDPDEYDPKEMVVVCTHCLLDRHLEAGRGMDVAKETGEAALVEGEWVVAEP